MKLHKDITNFNAKKPVVTVGTFDGLHLGHRKIIEKLKEIAKKTGGESVVFSFWPHPKKVIKTNKQIKLLDSLEEKIQHFKNAGIDHLILYRFDNEFAQMNYKDFVEKILVNKLNAKTLAIGYDHKFGKDRSGEFSKLLEIKEKYGLEIKKIEAYSLENNNISSTKIRNALQEGNVYLANKYLGYYYSLSGIIIQGKKIGRKLGFPTANIQLIFPEKLIPAKGVYAVNVFYKNEKHYGMLNIGNKPTVDTMQDINIEVHIFNFNMDIYNKEIRIEFRKRLRDERKFNSLHDLQKQLFADKIKIKKFFNI